MSNDTTSINYQPKPLVPSEAPHFSQRYPAAAGGTERIYGSGEFKRRRICVMRWEGEATAAVEVKDYGTSIEISLDATALRALAYQLLDAAHDIESVPSVEVARSAA